MADYFKHESSYVDEGCYIGAGSKIWHFCHVMKGARLGRNCIVGQNVNIDGGTEIGDNVKIQNNVSVYTGMTIEDDVFLGPSCVFTNVKNPRSQVNRRGLYEKTILRRGCTVGANATVMCGITIGRYAFIGAGSVVLHDVPDYALIIGNPGRQKGWMSRHGHVLRRCDEEGVYLCPESGLRYKMVSEEILICLDIEENDELPASMRNGHTIYGSYKIAKQQEEKEVCDE